MEISCKLKKMRRESQKMRISWYHGRASPIRLPLDCNKQTQPYRGKQGWNRPLWCQIGPLANPNTTNETYRGLFKYGVTRGLKWTLVTWPVGGSGRACTMLQPRLQNAEIFSTGLHDAPAPPALLAFPSRIPLPLSLAQTQTLHSVLYAIAAKGSS
jgi:hypothetical protein